MLGKQLLILAEQIGEYKTVKSVCVCVCEVERAI